MIPPEAHSALRRLRAAIRRHDRLYYVEAAPEISDFEYDRLYRELEALEAQYPQSVTADSPTQRVGGQPLAAFRPVRHALPMTSLANTYSRTEAQAFDGRVRKGLGERPFSYVVEPKIDGVAVSLRYEEGRLTQGATRGDGRIGDDITANLRTLRSVPLSLDATRQDLPSVLEVRGEVYMTRTGFAQLNAERLAAGETPFANARNAAAGSLKLLDARLVARRPLAAIFYAVGATRGFAAETHVELLQSLAAFGLPVPPRYWTASGMAEVWSLLDRLDEERRAFDFDTDGAVIKVNERSLYEMLGMTARNPRWAMAYKYQAEQAQTRVLDIAVQVGRTGVLTPVAELEPVLLAGSTVARATLHNADEIRRLDLRIGDLALVEKAGDVIPAVTGVLHEARPASAVPFAMPSVCPACGEAVTRREGEVALRCENLQCPAQIKRWIRHFASRGAMDIEGLGDALVEQLVDSGLAGDPADLYALDRGALLGLARMGERSADNVLQAVAASRSREFWRLIFALGIRHVGTRSAQALEARFADLDALIGAEIAELEAVPDIGPVVAASIAGFFANERNRRIVARLRDAGVSMRRAADYAEKSGPLVGRAYVLTGTLSTFTRDEAARRIRRMGGAVSGSLSRKTSALIVGAEPGSKVAKAAKLGVPTLDETAFLALIESERAVGPGEAEAANGEG